MKTIVIHIPKERIYADVGRSTAYTGGKATLQGNGDFDTIATVDEDSELLDGYLTDAMAAATERLRQYTAGADFAGEALSLTLEVSNSYDDSQTPGLVNNLTAYLSATVTSRWMRLTMASKADEWSAEASRLMNAIIGAICHRRAPRREKKIQ